MKENNVNAVETAEVKPEVLTDDQVLEVDEQPVSSPETSNEELDPAEKSRFEKNQKRKFYKYAAVNFTFYLTLIFGGYVTVFLQSIGFNPQQVGTISALNSGVGIFASPFWGMLSDKIRSLKKVIIIALTTSSLLFALIPWVSGMRIRGLSLLFLLIPITMFFRNPVMSLIDNWMLRNARSDKLDYGALRAFGALSFAIGSLALGYLIPMTGVEVVFYVSAVIAIPSLVLILGMKDRDTGDENGQEPTKRRSLTFKEMQFGQLFKNYYLVTFVLFSILLRIPFHSSMIFLPFLIYAVGGNVAQLGIIMGIRAAVEIPMMMLLKPLRQRFPLYILIMVATALFMTELLLYSIVNSFIMLVAVSIFHGLGNGLMLPSSASYVFSLAPEHLKATAQTILASMNAIAGIIGGLLGGLLIVMFDIQQFYFIIGITLSVSLIMFILSFFVGEKILGIKRPGLSLH